MKLKKIRCLKSAKISNVNVLPIFESKTLTVSLINWLDKIVLKQMENTQRKTIFDFPSLQSLNTETSILNFQDLVESLVQRLRDPVNHSGF